MTALREHLIGTLFTGDIPGYIKLKDISSSKTDAFLTKLD